MRRSIALSNLACHVSACSIEVNGLVLSMDEQPVVKYVHKPVNVRDEDFCFFGFCVISIYVCVTLS